MCVCFFLITLNIQVGLRLRLFKHELFVSDFGNRADMFLSNKFKIWASIAERRLGVCTMAKSL